MASALLPDNYSDFRTKKFWEGFFKELNGKEFEWYGDWTTLQKLLEKYIPSIDAKILVPGCGNSALSPALYDTGRKNITNIDFSPTCIREMLSRHVRCRNGMRWLVMDMTNMSFPDNSFDVVLDKGSLDAIMGDSEDTDGSVAAVNFLKEIKRVLDTRKNALYICISLAQTHVLQTLFDVFSSLYKDDINETSWSVTLRSIPPTEDMIDSPWQPFAIVAENTECPVSEILDVELDLDENIRNIAQSPHVIEVRSAIEEWSGKAKIAYEKLCKKNASLREMGEAIIAIKPGQRLCFNLPEDLQSSGTRTDSNRYKAAVLDVYQHQFDQCKTPCAVFLVPQGREHEWLFSSDEGQRELLNGCSTKRLIVVCMERGQMYGDMKEIQEELSPLVMQLTPASCRGGDVPVQYLTIVDGVGKRKQVHQCTSELNGDIVIEDVTLDDDGVSKVYRRMVFLSDSNLIQSEALMAAKPLKVKSKKKKEKMDKNVQIDHDFLSCNYHMAIVAGMSLVRSPLIQHTKSVHVLLIGLGGGGLPMFLKNQFNVDMKVVELDPVVLSLATAYFGFKESDKMEAVVGDGIEYIHNLKEALPSSSGLYDAVIIDASGTSSESISCPPKPFLDTTFLSGAYGVLNEGGIFVMNVVSRSDLSFNQAVDSLKTTFPNLHCVRVDNDINRVVFGLKAENTPLQKMKANASMFVKEMQKGDAHTKEILDNIENIFKL